MRVCLQKYEESSEFVLIGQIYQIAYLCPLFPFLNVRRIDWNCLGLALAAYFSGATGYYGDRGWLGYFIAEARRTGKKVLLVLAKTVLDDLVDWAKLPFGWWFKVGNLGFAASVSEPLFQEMAAAWPRRRVFLPLASDSRLLLLLIIHSPIDHILNQGHFLLWRLPKLRSVVHFIPLVPPDSLPNSLNRLLHSPPLLSGRLIPQIKL